MVQRKTIIVGLGGGPDSLVAAYLLKKQGHQVIGVSILPMNVEDKYFLRPRDPSIKESFAAEEKVNDTTYLERFLPNCHIPNLEKVKEQAENLEIPFYAVNASSQFRAEILERVKSAGITGHNYYPCTFCHCMLVHLLIEKAQGLKADYVATGHFAKIQVDTVKNTFSLCASNDPSFDQSNKLSRLKQEQLARLVLPLADMRREEVKKIAQSIRVNGQKTLVKKCFTAHPDMPDFIERVTPPSLRKAGQLMRFEDDILLGDHNGLHFHYIGQKLEIATGAEDQGQKASSRSGGEDMIVIDKNLKSGAITAAYRKNLRFNWFNLCNTNFHPLLDVTRSVKAFAFLPEWDHETKSRKELAWKCTVHFKAADNVYVELENEQRLFLPPGTYVSLYDSAERNGRLLLGGEVMAHPYSNYVFMARENEQEMLVIGKILEGNKKVFF